MGTNRTQMLTVVALLPVLSAGAASASAYTVQISGSASSQDAYVDASDAITNYGSFGNITLRNHAISNRTWGLLRFDLPTLAPGESITDATITIQYFENIDASPGSITVNLNRVLHAWVEDETTWNERSSGQRWEVGSGNIGWQDGSDPPANYDAASLGSVDLVVGAFGLKTFQSAALTAVLNEMAQGNLDNHGFLLNPFGGPTSGNRYFIVSSERNSSTPGEDFAPQLGLTIVPEPASLGLLAIGGVALLRWRR